MGSWVSHYIPSRHEGANNAGGRQVLIHVKTGDRRGAGTDANVRLSLWDERGVRSPVISLNKRFHNDHERGTTTTYTAYLPVEFSRLQKLEIWRDNFGLGSRWLLERIDVDDNDGVHVFPVHRWIAADIHYFLQQYDCHLPQDDPHQECRRKELRAKRRVYEYIVRTPGGPAQSKILPEDEQFSHDYKWDIIKNKSKMLVDTRIIKWSTEKWESLADLKKCYKYSLGDPHCLDCWNDDSWFGLQRVQGVNPVLITLCKEIPSKFGVTSEMVEPFLQGMTLEQAIEAKKIFIVDLEILKDLPCKDKREVCSPLALFYLNKASQLLPIAIQLFQEKGPDNPVFLPSDPTYTWLLAKLYYNNADAIYHQSLTHLGLTHLLMEGVVVCTHRNLSPSHPVFKLLAPHFLFLLAINMRGLEKLVSPGGWVDKTMTTGCVGMFELIHRCFEKLKVDERLILPNDFKKREVDDPEILPHYPYRDDVVEIYDALENYVRKMVMHFYESEEKLKGDYEMKQWRAELVKCRSLGGVGLRGVPGDDNEGFGDREQLVTTLTFIISTCSISHAAVNFQQYDEYAFPPNYPAILHGDIPRDKTPLSESDVLRHLPNKATTLDIMVITRLLSSKGTNSLGDFEIQYLYDEVSVQAAQALREDLRRISDKIKNRNRLLCMPYPWLDPDIVPNSISI